MLDYRPWEETSTAGPLLVCTVKEEYRLSAGRQEESSLTGPMLEYGTAAYRGTGKEEAEVELVGAEEDAEVVVGVVSAAAAAAAGVLVRG
jgi:hypothetical protein